METRSRRSDRILYNEDNADNSEDGQNPEEWSSNEEEDPDYVSNESAPKSRPEGKSKQLKQVEKGGKGEEGYKQPMPNSGTPLSTEDQKTKGTTKKKCQELWKIFGYVAGMLSVVVVAVILGSIITSYTDTDSASQHTGSNPNFDYKKIYEDGLRKLQEDFKNQTDRFWKILKSRGLAHLKKKSPPQPLVVLFVAPPSAHNVVDCLTKKLAAKLDPQYSKRSLVIDGKELSTSSGHTTKEQLDNKLKDTLQSGCRVAVIQNLELLPPPSPLLFHSYCDNDNAPYKHVSILFTVHLPREPDSSLSPVETEGLVEDYLSQEVWAGGLEYDLDAVAALLSRITDTVVVVSGEDEADLKSVCDSS